MDDAQTNDGSPIAQPTPDQADGQAGNDASSAQTNASPQAEDRAHSSLDRDEADRKALELLDAGKTPVEVRKELTTATPAADRRASTAAGKGESASNDSGATDRKAGEPDSQQQPDKPALTPAQIAAYDGLASKDRQALSQTSLLPDSETWNAFPDQVKANMIRSAKSIISDRSRNYQQQQAVERQRNERGQFQAADAQNTAQAAQQQAGQQTNPVRGTAQDVETGGAGTSAAQEARTQQANLLTAGGTAAAGKPNALDKIRKFVENVGEDVAGPLLEGFQELSQQHEAALQQQQQLLEQRDRQMDFILQNQIASEERQAQGELESELPGIAANAEQWQQIRQNASIFAKAAFDSGSHWTWRNCLIQAARSLLAPNIRQQVQRDLNQQRSSSLRSTPERGTRQARPQRAMSADERDQAALDALDSGKSVREIRESLY